jgi:hypothetical protein
MPLSNGIALHAGLFKADLEGSTTGGDGYTLAVTKAMSKRTTVYGAYSKVDSDPGSSFSITGTSAPSTTGQGTTALTFGIAHSF